MKMKAIARGATVYLAIILVTLGVMDVLLMITGLFPPSSNPGHAKVGWVSSPPTGRMETSSCTDPEVGARVSYQRNERGYRTSHSETELLGEGDLLEIAVAGDSHTDLCLPNEEMHFGLTEERLVEAGVDAAVFAYGAGRYSPLQEYVAIQDALADYAPDVFVMNLYTGNDFYDILRVDDRPHFVSTGDGYEVVPPVWYQFDPPGQVKRSRVLYAVGTVAKRVGVSGLWTRLMYLTAAARERNSGLGSVLKYVNDLRRARTPEVGYPAAFAAQILNQQLFFYHFPGSEEESMRRVRALMDLIREAHPDVLLVMSPIPSYQLVGEDPVDGAFTRLLERLPLSYEEGREMERSLFEELRREAGEAGWHFIDNLEPLQTYDGPGRLFNEFDYHVNLTANEIIAQTQARDLLELLNRPR